jgi:hypothetical protein
MDMQKFAKNGNILPNSKEHMYTLPISIVVTLLKALEQEHANFWKQAINEKY